uniref:Uncharacterized protein n=2 Tax=Neisseria meningitidis TaxID=487 RepID=C6SMQ4_NEIME|nr:hypothetical protein predicted by Glimmer/Critica [Neisseria meningitidis alpha275]CCA45245.1 hypothetical protein NMALPHA522_1704 [Neisseria meningitidis alpha522]
MPSQADNASDGIFNGYFHGLKILCRNAGIVS